MAGTFREREARRQRRITAYARQGALLSLNVGSLDDRPPLRNVSFLKRGQRLRSLLIRRRNLVPQFGETWLGRRVGQQPAKLGIELGNDTLRGALGSIDRESGPDVKSR
jgi:hypothetical protein